MSNDKLHKEALAVLKQMKPTSAEQKAQDSAFNYNARRREATARLGEVVSKIWNAFDRGETVGGATARKSGAKSLASPRAGRRSSSPAPRRTQFACFRP